MRKARRQSGNLSKVLSRRGVLASLGIPFAAQFVPGTTLLNQKSGSKLIKVASPTRALADWVSNASRSWARRNGVEVTSQTGQVGADFSQADLCLVEPWTLGQIADKAGRIPEGFSTRAELAWPDYLPVWRDRLGRWQGKPVGVPVMGEFWVQLVRSDLLADDSLQKAYTQATGKPLRAPRLWDDWVDLGKALHGKIPGRPGQPVLAPLPARAEDQVHLLRQIAACHSVERLAAGQRLRPGKEAENNHYAVDFDLLTGKPKIAGKAFTHALELLARLRPYQPEKPAEAPWQAFARGEALIAVVPASVVGLLQRSPVRDRFDIHPLPAAEQVFLDEGLLQTGQGNAIPYLGSQGALAVAAPEAPPQVWDLVAHLIQPKIQLDLVLDAQLGGPVREQQLQGAPWDGLQLDANRLAQWQSALRVTLSPGETINPAVALRTPDAARLNAELGKQVFLCLSGQGKAADCLKAAAEAWTKMGQERPDRLAEVRASAGLS